MLKKLRIAKYCYCHNIPFLTDKEYDMLEMKCLELYDESQVHYINEDAVVTEEECAEYNIPYFTNEFGTDSNKLPIEVEVLASQTNVSIRSLKTDDETLDELFAKSPDTTFAISPKLDGINLSIYLEYSEQLESYKVIFGKTRGDLNSSRNITELAKAIFPSELKTDFPKEELPKYLRLSFEALYSKEALAETGYKDIRSAANGVLSSTVNQKLNLYKHLKIIGHGASFPVGHKDLQVDLIKSMGLQVVPYVLFKRSSDRKDTLKRIYGVRHQFEEWVEENSLEIDGFVFDAIGSEEDINTSTSKIYNTNVFASKTGYWDREKYIATVTSISYAISSEELSYVLNIEPIKSLSNKDITKATNINLKTLIDNNIRKGTQIYLTYLNNTTPKYEGVYK